MLLRDRRVLGRELALHTAIGDLHGVGLDAHRVVLGQLRGERVERGLHRLARQREARVRSTSTPPARARRPRTAGLVVMLPSAPSSSMVPSDGLVVTPVTTLPTSGMASWTVCLMPSDDQVMFATSEPIDAAGVRGVLEPHVVDVHVDLHALGLADLIARGLDVDVRVVAGHVLHQKRRQRAERHVGIVLDHALDDRGHHAVGAAAGVQLAGQQRPRATSATTMTTIRTMDSGSRNRRLIFTSGDESFFGGSRRWRGRGVARRRPAGTVEAVGRAGPVGRAGVPAGGSGGPRDRSPPRFCLTDVGEL